MAQNFSLNLFFVKISEKSLTKADYRGIKQKDMSADGNVFLRLLFCNSSFLSSPQHVQFTSINQRFLPCFNS